MDVADAVPYGDGIVAATDGCFAWRPVAVQNDSKHSDGGQKYTKTLIGTHEPTDEDRNESSE